MKTRILTSIVLIAILIPVLIFADTVALPIGIALCALIAVYEMLSCMGLKKSVAISIPFYLSAAAFPFLIRYLNNLILLVDIAFAAIMITVLYLFSVLIFSHGKYTVQQMGAVIFAMLYIIVGFGAIVFVHDYEVGGRYIYLAIFIGAWITDIFAYFCGLLLGRGGKHKLIPDVSPKKTVEGSVGGILFCIIAMIVFGIVIDATTVFHADLLVFALAGLIVSVVSQIGDLSMSVIKRTYGIKDYGKIFPGHGGILDRFDSILAVALVLLVFSRFFNFLTVL
ncbi:MAG: phosphatidate cytidylyltransferase [Clostridia bacterium]|nr:phosphatidate cytidylyltransferase [Clostridia bacterium]